jgi:hypothetical protein
MTMKKDEKNLTWAHSDYQTIQCWMIKLKKNNKKKQQKAQVKTDELINFMTMDIRLR